MNTPRTVKIICIARGSVHPIHVRDVPVGNVIGATCNKKTSNKRWCPVCKRTVPRAEIVDTFLGRTHRPKSGVCGGAIGICGRPMVVVPSPKKKK